MYPPKDDTEENADRKKNCKFIYSLKFFRLYSKYLARREIILQITCQKRIEFLLQTLTFLPLYPLQPDVVNL